MVTMCVSFVFANSAIAQSTTQIPQSLDSLGNQVMKLMEFYESYDDGSPESLKKAKYENAVDELFGGAASKKDKEDAYQIIDAYIKGDKALEQDKPQKPEHEQSFDDAIKNTDEAKAGIKFLNQQQTMLMQMSYSDFEASILKFNPVASKKEIKMAFNKMHKNDGKQVAITAADEVKTEAQIQFWALETIQNPKNYDDFRKALKIINPDIPDNEIRIAWDNHDK
jgi:hypothetical protein